tara:strand:+ start:254 stop:499 length:246 start_codon:yes stop_codon:yes gene_type:complete
MNITVKIKNNFGNYKTLIEENLTSNSSLSIIDISGNEVIYPACEHSRLFAEIAGTKTLTRETIEKIKSLGYLVGVAAPQKL